MATEVTCAEYLRRSEGMLTLSSQKILGGENVDSLCGGEASRAQIDNITMGDDAIPLWSETGPARAMLLLTHRPEYAVRWGAQAHVTALTLNRLGKRQGAALIESTTGGKALPAEVVEQILAKTDGVPLLVEELTKAVLESDLLAEGPQGYVLTRPLTDFAIPSTLHASLMARLDRTIGDRPRFVTPTKSPRSTAKICRVM